MNQDIRLKGRLKFYMQWPIILTILLIVMNIWVFKVNKEAGAVMIFFVLVYAIAVVFMYLHSRYIVLSDMTDCRHKFVIGLCNDELGYILAENDFLLNETLPYINKATDDMDRDHYEETNSTGPETGRIILDETESLIKSAK